MPTDSTANKKHVNTTTDGVYFVIITIHLISFCINAYLNTRTTHIYTIPNIKFTCHLPGVYGTKKFTNNKIIILYYATLPMLFNEEFPSGQATAAAN